MSSLLFRGSTAPVESGQTMRLSGFIFLVFLAKSKLPLAEGHGYLVEPPARNSCYKVFQNCKANYNLNGLNCGGRATQIANGNKCGVCGDSYSSPSPPHVYPGKYATGFITKTYTQGQNISVKVIITANHLGWFEYRIGDIGTPPITNEKLKHLLRSPSGQTRFPLDSRTFSTSHDLVLPAELRCDRCVLQWWWKAGNSWGCDGDGCGLGHGHQETFVNCADVKIVSRPGVIPTESMTSSSPCTHSTRVMTSSLLVTHSKTTVTSIPPVTLSTTGDVTSPPPSSPRSSPKPSKPQTAGPIPGNGANCASTGVWAGRPGIDVWCRLNCAAGYCPSFMCACRESHSNGQGSLKDTG
ncbi:uncharacterized protein LOC5522282 isoform X2 [Nematostella vectensis]|uniref:uncharacterized protein LOC5522282 isoform X2 n=1 Tax=Nematostella vectensis TaxID=45351 RepID=UPI002077497D|nr:uncharacterized protein LOC5522282 isoform X2 [Nematostella vectensis]